MGEVCGNRWSDHFEKGITCIISMEKNVEPTDSFDTKKHTELI